MVFASGFCLRSGISSLSPVLGQIQSDLGIGSAALGALTAIPVVCMGLLSPLGHQVEQRIGLRNGMVFALVILVVGLCLRYVSNGYALLLLTAGLVGIADAIIRPMLSGFIKSDFKGPTARVMGFYSMSMGAGSASAAFLTLPLAVHLSSGWRGGLAVWALPAALAAILWLAWRDRHSDVTTASGQATSANVSRVEIVAFTLFFGMQAGINYSLVAWLPISLLGYGMDQHGAGLVIAGFIVLQTVTSLLFNEIMRGLRIATRRMFVVATILAAAGVVALWVSLPIVGAVLLGVATGFLFPLALLLPLEFTHTRSDAVRLSGTTQSGGYLIGGAVPWLAGIVADFAGPRIGMSALLTICILLLAVATASIRLAYARRSP